MNSVPDGVPGLLRITSNGVSGASIAASMTSSGFRLMPPAAAPVEQRRRHRRQLVLEAAPARAAGRHAGEGLVEVLAVGQVVFAADGVADERGADGRPAVAPRGDADRLQPPELPAGRRVAA